MAGEWASIKALVRAGYNKLKSKLPGNKGIDGVWIKRNERNEIIDILIVESKAAADGVGSLGKTKHIGDQMSTTWISDRLKKMAASDDPDLKYTAELIEAFIASGGKVRKKINVLDPFGRNRWNVLPPPDGGTYP
uniref:Uncharacterized protein n=1 Tax=Schlesneria paludicola TaxID=360056 RepID=A0A7C2K0F7_9PLAN